MLTPLNHYEETRLYLWDRSREIRCLIATTPETRSICNDPLVLGTNYTNRLRTACAQILRAGELGLDERGAVVVNILRGGLNFGLREAMTEAFGWQAQTTCFISAQRARNAPNSEEWHITENAYQKLYFPPEISLVIGDVVATGTSLRYALHELLEAARQANARLRNIVFFTYGGPMAVEILEDVDRKCRELFPEYGQTTLIFLEGCFQVPSLDTPLTIRLTGTDLVRLGSVMPPEFIESQYENPAYPIERCIIYDAGSRAFWVREDAADVAAYWRQVLDLAKKGVSYDDYLHERFPELDPERFGHPSLIDIASHRIDDIQRFAL